MQMLLAGMVLWIVTHTFPMAMPRQRAAIVAKIGEAPYKGLFALVSILSIALIVWGSGQAPIVQVYVPPLFGGAVIALLIGIGLTLMAVSALPNNIRRFVRHPQLSGVAIWAVAHLLVNGTVRDLILFGGFGLWAVAGIVLSNLRDGPWQRPAAVALWKDVVVVAVGVAVTGLLLHFHGVLFGVTAIHR